MARSLSNNNGNGYENAIIITNQSLFKYSEQ